MAKNQKTISTIGHILVPKHSKLSDKDKKELLDTYNIKPDQLPKISIKDPAIKEIELEINDVIKIERKSKTAKTSIYYRVVIDG